MEKPLKNFYLFLNCKLFISLKIYLFAIYCVSKSEFFIFFFFVSRAATRYGTPNRVLGPLFKLFSFCDFCVFFYILSILSIFDVRFASILCRKVVGMYLFVFLYCILLRCRFVVCYLF